MKLRDWISNNPDITSYGIITAAIGILVYVIVLLVNLSSTEEMVITKKSYIASVDLYKWTTVRRYSQYMVPACAWDVDENTYCAQRDSSGYCIDWDTEYDYSERDWKYLKTLSLPEKYCIDCNILQSPAYSTGDYWKVYDNSKYYLHGVYRKGKKSISVNEKTFKQYQINDTYKFKRFLGKIR